MSRFSHLTNTQYRAMQCQILSANYAAQARKLRDSLSGTWKDDVANANHWASEYARDARYLMGIE